MQGIQDWARRSKQPSKKLCVAPCLQVQGSRRGMPCVCRVVREESLALKRVPCHPLGTRKACLYGDFQIVVKYWNKSSHSCVLIIRKSLCQRILFSAHFKFIKKSIDMFLQTLYTYHLPAYVY